MKRFILFIHCFFVLFTTIAKAEDKDLTTEQRALRAEIFGFLKEEGFCPEIDSDGDIKFRSEGHPYYVRVSSVDENPMFIEVYRLFSNPDDISPETIVMATKELNLYKGAKVVCFDSSFRICGELYLRDSELFKEAFYKLKSQIDNVSNDFLDECEKATVVSGSISEIPFIITKMEVANVEKDGTIIQDYGSSIYDFKTKYLKPRITIKPFKTSGTYTLYIKLYQNNVLSAGSSDNTYSYTGQITINGSSPQVFTISGWGSTTAGNWSMGTYRFEVWYGDYCIGSKTFKVI